MRISDWSSDVFSSDLCPCVPPPSCPATPGRLAPERSFHRHHAPLRARPAVLVRLAGLRERRAVALGDVLVVEDEVEQEHAAQVCAAEVEARSHHARSEEHTSELQSLMSNSYADFC